MTSVSSVPLRKIKIPTRRMPDVSWRDLWGRRKELKNAIRVVVETKPELQAAFKSKGRIVVEALGTKHIWKPGRYHGLYGVSQLERARVVSSFTVNGQAYVLSDDQKVEIRDN